MPGAESDDRPLVGVFARPWTGAHDVYGGATQSRRAPATTPAIMGELLWALYPGPVDRWDEGNVIRIKLFGGALASATRDDVLNSANALVIDADGEWEIIQAAQCELVEHGVYELRGFLRGRQGSAHAMRSPHPIGARIVKLDQRLARVGVDAHEWHEPITFISPPPAAPPFKQSRGDGSAHAAACQHSPMGAGAPSCVARAVGRCDTFVGALRPYRRRWVGTRGAASGLPYGELPAGDPRLWAFDPQRNDRSPQLCLLRGRTNVGFRLSSWIVALSCSPVG